MFALAIRTLLLTCCLLASGIAFAEGRERPNIMIMISDDVSWPHASAYGSKMVSTPAFDRIAKEGVLFNNAFCPSPGCSPSRAAFLSGRHTWMIEHAGTHGSYFGPQYETFQNRLADAGYHVGCTGKGWGPGKWNALGRKRAPDGKKYGGDSKKDLSRYVSGFAKFMGEREADKPFCFWFGSNDAHRSYAKGSGLKKGKTLDQAEVPGFLPDAPEIRSDLLDYAFEVERFDDDCAAMIKMIQEAGEYENTIFVVTSDNGMPFPRAKANCYEYGIHMPLAMSWKAKVPGNRTSDDLVGFVDIAATIYDASGVESPTKNPIVGSSLMSLLESEKSGIIEPQRSAVYSARERHSSSRFNSLGYPQRCIRTHDYLYIRNFRPERWPAGPSQKYASALYDSSGNLVEGKLGPEHGGYHDIDACPSLSFLIAKRDDPKFGRFLDLSVGMRPAEELFDIKADADCLNNLAGKPKYSAVQKELSGRLLAYLKETGDSRVLDGGDLWETYPRMSGVRWFEKPAWADDASKVPAQDWLDARRKRAK